MRINNNDKNDKENETPIESEFNKLNISDLAAINHENCVSWCKECVPSCIIEEIIEGWTSGNSEIDNFIKDTIYNAKLRHNILSSKYHPIFLEWVPFDRFEDIKQIGEGGFAKVYSANWIDGQAIYKRQDNGSWKKSSSLSKIVALKRLNGSQNMSDDYLNEVFYVINIFY
jgi:hypothetical protein